MAMQKIQKIETLRSIISAPFVTCEFGGEQFGLTNRYDAVNKVRDIRYVNSLTINKKASGQVNTYTLGMNYVVEPGADPNYIDYIISRAMDRKITFSYGDSSQPEYSYVKEQAIITQVTPSINFQSNVLAYSIKATSSVAIGYSIKRNFPARTAKPSDVIFEQLYVNTDNGLLELFSGMQNRAWVEENKLIARNDRVVYIGPVQDKTPLEYIRILLSKMQAVDNSFFAMLIHDEPDNIDGPYFEIVNSNLYQGTGQHYSVDIDVGYPSDTPLYSFTPTQNVSLAAITPFQEKYDKDRIININEKGVLEKASTLSLAISQGSASAEALQWWKNMTNYPITATLTTRGLIKPSILCDYIHINVLFFGQKYNYSGYYMVTGQDDILNMSSYNTQLSLVRVQGD